MHAPAAIWREAPTGCKNHNEPFNSDNGTNTLPTSPWSHRGRLNLLSIPFPCLILTCLKISILSHPYKTMSDVISGRWLNINNSAQQTGPATFTLTLFGPANVYILNQPCSRAPHRTVYILPDSPTGTTDTFLLSGIPATFFQFLSEEQTDRENQFRLRQIVHYASNLLFPANISLQRKEYVIKFLGEGRTKVAYHKFWPYSSQLIESLVRVYPSYMSPGGNTFPASGA